MLHRGIAIRQSDDSSFINRIYDPAFVDLFYRQNDRLTDKTDLVIGTPSANRRHPDQASLIGYFPNVLPLRLDLSGDATSAQLRERTRECMLEAQDHQGMTLAQLQVAMQFDGRPKHIPLYRHGLNLLHYVRGNARGKDGAFSHAEFQIRVSIKEDVPLCSARFPPAAEARLP